MLSVFYSLYRKRISMINFREKIYWNVLINRIKRIFKSFLNQDFYDNDMLIFKIELESWLTLQRNTSLSIELKEGKANINLDLF